MSSGESVSASASGEVVELAAWLGFEIAADTDVVGASVLDPSVALPASSLTGVWVPFIFALSVWMCRDPLAWALPLIDLFSGNKVVVPLLTAVHSGPSVPFAAARFVRKHCCGRVWVM